MNNRYSTYIAYSLIVLTPFVLYYLSLDLDLKEDELKVVEGVLKQEPIFQTQDGFYLKIFLENDSREFIASGCFLDVLDQKIFNEKIRKGDKVYLNISREEPTINLDKFTVIKGLWTDHYTYISLKDYNNCKKSNHKWFYLFWLIISGIMFYSKKKYNNWFYLLKKYG